MQSSQHHSRGARRGISRRGRLQIGPKRVQTGPNGPNWAFWAFARNAQLDILGIRPKCPIGPVWAQSGPIGPIWAQMDTPKRTLNTRHPTSANCGDNPPETGVKSPRLQVPRLAALNGWQNSPDNSGPEDAGSHRRKTRRDPEALSDQCMGLSP